MPASLPGIPPKFPILKYFDFSHLPSGPARETSAQFHQLAHTLALSLPLNAESSTALRKLLEAKDCAVRSVLP